MPNNEPYAEKFTRIASSVELDCLSPGECEFIRAHAFRHRFTQQELKQVVDMAVDFRMWNEATIRDLWPAPDSPIRPDKAVKQRLIRELREHWESLKRKPKSYNGFAGRDEEEPEPIRFLREEKQQLGLGRCPVASPRTRCCNLMTLDAVENCGFDCSYCSIQSFYHGNEIRFDRSFADKLARLELDPGQTYHIGTGQSSDSLMWGNREGVLDALIAFARRNPNLILELKTKSKNVSYLLRQDLPPNILCTWSLNTPTIVANEERHTAPLEQRLKAARRLADQGVLVGFHLHPMVHYDCWRDDYAELFGRLQDGFAPREVAMVSLGTLTFIKPVMRQIRRRAFKSKILQMHLDEADGKFSYPEDLKIEMFRHAYRSLAGWHEQVFFYLCMESPRLWEAVFGYQFGSNREFETAMKGSYLAKIRQLRKRRE